MTLTPCPHRGRLFESSQQCACRHPQVTGPDHKSVPVPVTRCETCPIPNGGELTDPPPPVVALSVPTQVILTGGPGTELLQLLTAMGVPPCQQCHELAAQMDGWGVDGCQQRLETIVNDILPRARKWANQGWLTSLTPDVALKAGVRHHVRRAIKNAARQSDSDTA